jgi:hypothetical protein
MLLNALALAVTLALAPAEPQAAAGPPAAQAPGPALSVMSFAFEVGPQAGAAGQQWAQELRAALETRKQEFRPARKDERPELLVRIDSVAPAATGGSVLNAALVFGAKQEPFVVRYSTEIRPMAEKLARNLRRLAEERRGAAPPATAAARKKK